ncbi:DUF86 domain-containing protein [Chitinophaga sp. YIM B06452]|uniref:HepT-like ribonuclease domain-containing protein n=1 Tax=Chitinophaga sp. YIM B06452 TaxID=3082158 RepID=UPI0031FE8DE0
MSKRKPELLIEDIIESGNKILTYSRSMSFEEFVKNDMVVDAVIRNFEIIGEAANRLPDEFKENHPDIDWHRIRGFRNRIVHDYFGIDYKIVWTIKETFLPDLIEKLRLLIP